MPWQPVTMPTTPEVWVKPSAPLITATLPWENNQVGEPSVVPPSESLSGFWEMYYQAGWTNSQIGKAVCSGGDPQNPAHWVKHGPPIIGTVAGNFWMPAAHHSAIMINGVLHIYFSSVGTNGVNCWLATSDDGVNFDVRNIPVILTGAEDAVMGNPALLLKDGVLYNWYEYNLNPAAGNIWKTGLAVADPANPAIFVKQGPIPSLQVGTGTYGGHSVREVGRLLNAWSINSKVGVTPSEIYHHYSVEGKFWGILNGGNPVLRITQAWEGDQVADPEVHGMADHSLMFYSTVNNPAATGTICVARINSPLSAICPA